mgnify:CR=1 FL=1
MVVLRLSCVIIRRDAKLKNFSRSWAVPPGYLPACIRAVISPRIPKSPSSTVVFLQRVYSFLVSISIEYILRTRPGVISNAWEDHDRVRMLRIRCRAQLKVIADDSPASLIYTHQENLPHFRHRVELASCNSVAKVKRYLYCIDIDGEVQISRILVPQ